MTRNACGLWVVVLLASNVAGADEKPTIEDVKKAWKARQEANKSFRIEWVETVKYKAGCYDDLLRPPVTDVPGPHPPKDTEFTAACSFATDGDKAAAADERLSYHVSEKIWKPSLESTVFDGRTSMTAYPLDDRPGWGSVSIQKAKDQAGRDLRTRVRAPVQLFYRPMGGGAFLAFEFENAKLSDRTEKIRGVSCVEIVLKDVPPGSTYSLWCDRERGFLPIREKQRYADDRGYDLDWEYRKDDKGRWVPTGWQRTDLNPKGALRSSVKAEVKKLELDHKFAADAFAPNPPPSSYVTVYENGDRKEDYLVRPDGSKRPLKPSERGKDPNELIKTNADGTPYVPPKK